MTYIDLFAGCGGLSLGLHNAGWEGFFAVEKNKDAFTTLQYNLVDKVKHFKWPNWLPLTNLDINEVIDKYKSELEGLKGQIALVAGGPPCQGFSSAGRRNEDDERNKLVDSYINFVAIVKPKIVLMENVKGFTVGFKKKKNDGKVYSSYVQQKLEGLGYKTKWDIVDMSEFGIPQRRKRFILVGCLDKNPDDFFHKLKENNANFLKTRGLQSRVNLNDAISDLLKSNGVVDSPDTKGFKAGVYSKSLSIYQTYLRKGILHNEKACDSHRFANHCGETIDKFQRILDDGHRNKSIHGDERKKYDIKKRSIFVLDGDEVCPTLTSNPDDYIHYCEPRSLTVREYARIQSFPDWYEIKGKYTTGGKLRVKEVPRYTQLGNAIPPLFGEQMGLALKELL
jgi:DNA (cytosine-5)-methyltransferase 1